VLSFYDRYQAGEHQQVWSELVALGDDVRQQPVYADALAVANETMRRARANIETLIGRLHDIVYNFKSGREAGMAVARMLEGLAAQTPDFLKMAGSIPSEMWGAASTWIARPQDAQAGIERLAKNMMGIAMAQPPRHPLEDGAVYGRASLMTISGATTTSSRVNCEGRSRSLCAPGMKAFTMSPSWDRIRY
jgi:hypothetical protein